MELSYTKTPNAQSQTKHWYVIRITHNRTINVYNAVKGIKDFDFELYCPCHRQKTFTFEGDRVKQSSLDIDQSNLILPGFLFVNATEGTFRKLLDFDISGLTPYYDHFHKLSTGVNPFLIVPDQEFANFRRFCDAQDNNKLIDQKDVPSYLNGKRVRIISGPFAGVEGTVLRWHNMRRVFIALGNIATFGTGFIRSCDFELVQ